MTTERFTVEGRPAESRYVLIDHGEEGTDAKEIGLEAYVDMEGAEGAQRILYHTVVADDYAGQGLASLLVKHVIDDTIAAGRTIVPVCPYVRSWLPKHPEYEPYVVPRRQEHLDAVAASPFSW